MHVKTVKSKNFTKIFKLSFGPITQTTKKIIDKQVGAILGGRGVSNQTYKS